MALSYSEFLAAVDEGRVATVTIGAEGDTRGELTDGTPFTTAIPVQLSGDELLARLEERGVEIEAVPPRLTLAGILLSLAPFLLLLALFIYLGKRASGQLAGMAGLGRSNAKEFDSERPKTTFADVAGHEGVKREVAEVVEFLRDPTASAAPGPPRRAASSWSGPRAPARRCSHGRSPARRTCRSCRSPARASWRCSSASARRGCATCSPKLASAPRRSSSSKISTPSGSGAAAGAGPSPTTSGSRPSTSCWPR